MQDGKLTIINITLFSIMLTLRFKRSEFIRRTEFDLHISRKEQPEPQEKPQPQQEQESQEEPKQELEFKVCYWCGETYEVSEGDGLFCSEICRAYMDDADKYANQAKQAQAKAKQVEDEGYW